MSQSQLAINAKDNEQLVIDIRQLKEKYSLVKQENVFLRTQVQRLASQLRKKDKQMQQILAIKVVDNGDTNGQTALLAALRNVRNEMMSISKITSKVRELESTLVRKDEELKKIKSTIKFTNIKELEIESQTYYNEAKRLKKMVDKLLTANASNSSTSSIPSSAFNNKSGSKRPLSREAEADNAEMARLRDEVKQLRRENSQFKANQYKYDNSAIMLQRVKDQIDILQRELASCQAQIALAEADQQQQNRSYSSNELDAKLVYDEWSDSK